MVLVTGATGFVGSELVRQLLENGENVRVLRRETSKMDLLGESAGRVQHVVGDVTDPDSLVTALENVDSVYHAAAYIGFGGPNDARRLHEINVEGTANVVDAATEAGVRRLVHFSSVAAFGRTAETSTVIDETSEWVESPYNSEYARSKYLSELEVHRAIAEGLNAVIVNPSLIFGPGRSGENTALIVERARRGAAFAPAGGTNVVDVADVAAGAIRAMAEGRTGERYFLGSENLRFMEILGTLAEAFGAKPPRVALPLPLAMAAGAMADVASRIVGRRLPLTLETARVSGRFYRYSNAKAVEQLGCSFRPFTETARRIAEQA